MLSSVTLSICAKRVSTTMHKDDFKMAFCACIFSKSTLNIIFMWSRFRKFGKIISMQKLNYECLEKKDDTIWTNSVSLLRLRNILFLAGGSASLHLLSLEKTRMYWL